MVLEGDLLQVVAPNLRGIKWSFEKKELTVLRSTNESVHGQFFFKSGSTGCPWPGRSVDFPVEINLYLKAPLRVLFDDR